MYRAELFKLRSIRAPWITAAIAVAGMLFMQALSLLIPRVPSIAETLASEGVGSASLLDPATEGFQRDLIALVGVGPGGGSSVGIVPAAILLLGVLAATSDLRSSIVPTLLAAPHRVRVVAGKVGALVTASTIVAVVLAAVTALGLFTSVSTTEGASIALGATEILGVWGRGVVVLALLALLGFGIGMLVRSQVAAIVIACALLFVEPMVQAIAALLSPGSNPTAWLPMTLSTVASTGHSASQLLGGSTGMGAGTALGVLAAWVAVLVTAATLAFRARDIA